MTRMFSSGGFITSDLIVILSNAKLQRSGQSPRGQAFHLWSLVCILPTIGPEMSRLGST
jgi:hypothetical protein